MIALPYGFGLSAPGSLVTLAVAALVTLPFWRTWRRMLLAAAGAAALGAALFLIAVWLVQAPAQLALATEVQGLVSPFWLGAHLWLLPLALALVAALLQEGGRLGALYVAVRGLARKLSPTALGAAVGAGVGFVEAAMVLGAIPPAAFQVASLAVVERIGAVAFHVGAGALLGAGLARGRTLAAFGSVVAVHWLVDGLAALHGVALVGLAVVEAVNLVAGLGLLTLGALLAAGRDAERRRSAA